MQKKTVIVGDLTNSQEKQRLAQHLETLYQKSSWVPTLTSDPNGSVSGNQGDKVHLVVGGTHYLSVNVDGSKTWKKVALT